MKFNKSLAAIHGYLCADGYVCTNLPHQKHKYYSIGLRNTRYTLLKDFHDKFYEVFKVKPRLIRGQRCHIYSKGLYYRLMENGPYHSNNWSLPILSKDNLRYWLRAFYDCESWVIADKRKTRSVCLESINKEQLPKIQEALAKFKINSKIYERKNRTTSMLTIPDRKSLENYQKYIGFLHPKKIAKLKKCINSFIDYSWNISEENALKIFKEKAKTKKPYSVRVNSIKKENLEKLANTLKDAFKIDSKIYQNKNKAGCLYYSLIVQKKDHVKRLIDLNLLNQSQISRINRNLLK